MTVLKYDDVIIKSRDLDYYFGILWKILCSTTYIQIFIATTMFIIFWDILIDEQIFFSPWVTGSVIIGNKHGIYQLPNELSKDLRLTILGN